MPRPRMCRRVRREPNFSLFKPAGVPARHLDFVVLTVGEYEAVRLSDLEELSQKDAAEKMSLSQPTFQRILSNGRKKLASAIVNGKAIKIEGGSYKLA